MTITSASLTWRDRFAGSGVALMVASVLAAPMIDIFAKLATATVPAAEITLGRFIVQAGLMLPFARVTIIEAIGHVLRGVSAK